jgi:hypothetical protein
LAGTGSVDYHAMLGQTTQSRSGRNALFTPKG